MMNQEKMGAFLRSLRKEKGMPQENLSELLHVNRRCMGWGNLLDYIFRAKGSRIG